MPRGGKRTGAGRKSNAVRWEEITRAAEETLSSLKDGPNPLAILHEILAFHTAEFKKAHIRHKAGHFDSKNLREHAAGIRATISQIVEYRRAFPDQGNPGGPPQVIRAPEIAKSADEWRNKYAPEPGSEAPRPAANAALERLQQFAEAATELPPKPRLAWDADQPPARVAEIDETTRNRLNESLFRRRP